MNSRPSRRSDLRLTREVFVLKSGETFLAWEINLENLKVQRTSEPCTFHQKDGLVRKGRAFFICGVRPEKSTLGKGRILPRSLNQNPESVVSGWLSHLSIVITKPLEEARSHLDTVMPGNSFSLMPALACWALLAILSDVVASSVAAAPLPIGAPSPANSTNYTGEDALLFIDTQETGPIQLQWRLNGTNIPGANAIFLPLYNLSLNDAGLYDVIITNLSLVQTSGVAKLTIIGAAPTVSFPNFAGPSVLDAPFTLSVNAIGSKAITFQWYLNGGSIPGETNAQLVSKNFSGDYYVVLSNAFGTATSDVYRSYAVHQAPGEPFPPWCYYHEHTSRTAHAGDMLAMSEHFTGSEPLLLQWQVNGTNIPAATNSILLLPNLRPADSGDYRVTAANRYGTNALNLQLTVNPRRGLDHWTWSNPLPQGNDLDHIVYHHGRYVAGGEWGSLITSTNALNWSGTTLGSNFKIKALAAGNNIFAALVEVTDGDSTLVLRSTDGATWVPQNTAPLSSATSLSFTDGRFLLFGGSLVRPNNCDPELMLAASSSDGVHWDVRPVAGTSFFPRQVAYSNGTYVAVTDGDWTNPPNVFRSSDAVHWAPAPAYLSGLYGAGGISFLNGSFVLRSSTGLFSSTDGMHWSPRLNYSVGTSLAFGNGQYVMISYTNLYTSSDLSTWTPHNAGITKNLHDVLFDGRQFVVCGNDGVILTSTNGANWTDQRKNETKDLYAIIYTNGQFTAAGDKGAIMVSTDGVTWITSKSGTTRNLHGLVYGAGLYVAVGAKGAVFTSPDSQLWSTRLTPTTNNLKRVAYGSGKFVAVGEMNTILSSTDGLTWSAAPSPLPVDAEIAGVTSSAGLFVAVGGYYHDVLRFGDFGAYYDNTVASAIVVSSDGVHWTSAGPDAGVHLRGVGFAERTFFTVGNDGIYLTSTNGLNWVQSYSPGYGANLRQVTFGSGRWVAVGNKGTIVSGPATELREIHPGVALQNLHDIAYGQNKFVAVGNEGTIVQSGAALPFLSQPHFQDHAFSFTFSGGLEPSYLLQASDDFKRWETMTKVVNDGTPQSHSFLTNTPHRFYRAIGPSPESGPEPPQ